MQPEIMACGCHQEENYQRKQTGLLKRKIGNAVEPRVRSEHAYQWIHVSERMKLNNRKDTVYKRQEKHCHTEMSPVIEQRQEAPVEPAQRPDREDYMQE
jgi:hypothetical protein